MHERFEVCKVKKAVNTTFLKLSALEGKLQLLCVLFHPLEYTNESQNGLGALPIRTGKAGGRQISENDQAVLLSLELAPTLPPLANIGKSFIGRSIRRRRMKEEEEDEKRKVVKKG
jgi:hypothetical protein